MLGLRGGMCPPHTLFLSTIAVCCSFGSKHVTPRSLSADLLGCLVCVEGIITKSQLLPLLNFPPTSLSVSGSQVRPKVVKSVHYCPATGKTMERKYTDLTSLEPFPTSAVYPTKVRGQTTPTPVKPVPNRMRMGIPWRQSMDSPSIAITRPSVSRRPQRELQQASCHGHWMLFWMVTLSTAARSVTGPCNRF